MLTQLIIFLYIIVFLYGIVIGSFLNVLIFRIPKKENIVQSSHCMNCGRKLGWWDMVPVFSYIILRGRCRQCGARISIQYPLIEALMVCCMWSFSWRAVSRSAVCCIAS